MVLAEGGCWCWERSCCHLLLSLLAIKPEKLQRILFREGGRKNKAETGVFQLLLRSLSIPAKASEIKFNNPFPCSNRGLGFHIQEHGSYVAAGSAWIMNYFLVRIHIKAK